MLQGAILAGPFAYWIRIKQTTSLSTLVSHTLRKKNSKTSTFDTNYILIILEVFGFEEKLNSGQKSLCPNLDKIRSNTRQSVKIISFHFLYKP